MDTKMQVKGNEIFFNLQAGEFNSSRSIVLYSLYFHLLFLGLCHYF